MARAKGEGSRMGLIASIRTARNLRVFRRLERSVAEAKDLARQVELAKIATAFARQSGCGCFGSPTIDGAFLERAKGIRAKLSDRHVPGTVLMVLSEAYFWGGHTRAVERWIEADRSRRYSVVVTRQGKDAEFPARLRTAVVKSGGTVEVMSGEDGPETRAARLREVSSAFEFVVLHVHPDDPLPILAYGTPEFRRPVGLYDHLDYSFWLGASVADGVGELRTWGADLSRERRGLENLTVLGIPGDAPGLVLPDRTAARGRLGLPPDAKVVMTTGAVYKYRPMPERDFLGLATALLKASPKSLVVGIGMTFEDFPAWKAASDRFGGRLRALGKLPHDKFMDALAAADVVVDSWPIPGFTALADAVQCGCPVLTCPTPGGLMDWMRGSSAECATPSELVRRVREILDDPSAGTALLEDVVPRLEASRAPAEFVRRVEAFYAGLAGGHSVRAFEPRFGASREFDDFLSHMEMFDFKTAASWWCRDLYGKWSWMAVSFDSERHPWKAPLLWLRWALKGCR